MTSNINGVHDLNNGIEQYALVNNIYFAKYRLECQI